MVQLGGLEPPTSCSTDRRSNQLSYNCILASRASGRPSEGRCRGGLDGAETRCNGGFWQGRKTRYLPVTAARKRVDRRGVVHLSPAGRGRVAWRAHAGRSAVQRESGSPHPDRAGRCFASPGGDPTSPFGRRSAGRGRVHHFKKKTRAFRPGFPLFGMI